MEDGEQFEPEVWDCGESEQSGFGVEGESSTAAVAYDGWAREEGSASAAAEEEGFGGRGGAATYTVGE